MTPFPIELDDFSELMLEYRIEVQSHSTGGLTTSGYGRLADVAKEADRLALARSAHKLTVRRVAQRRGVKDVPAAVVVSRIYAGGKSEDARRCPCGEMFVHDCAGECGRIEGGANGR